MSKNINNIKKKEAFKRKESASLSLANMGMSLSSNLLCIGIILKDFSNTELINQINKICLEYVGIDFAFFLHNNFINNFSMCPVFDLRSLIQWDYPLITTDLSTTITALSSKSNNIYFYMKDIETIPQNIIDNKKIKFITKNSNMAGVIMKNLGIKEMEIIENLNMMEIIQLINKDLKNEIR